jgi:hypothetical protein
MLSAINKDFACIDGSPAMNFHYYSQFKENLDDEHERLGRYMGGGFEIAFTHDIWNFTNHLLKLGLIPVIRNDNVHCPHCTEVTLMSLRTSVICFLFFFAVRLLHKFVIC